MGIRDRIKAFMAPVDGRAAGWRSLIHESFPGAWQQNVTIDNRENVMRFSAVYGCISGIAGDIAKLPINVMRQDSGINVPQPAGRMVDLMRRPNHYQTRFQFIQHWALSKLITGNTYCLKVRDSAGRIEKLIVLEPEFVTVLVSDSGDVYYQLRRDNLGGLNQTTDVTVPATEIMHDRHTPLFHPLVGVSPIYACGMSATLGNAITNTSAGFFKNKATPGGLLSAPGRISDDTAARLKKHWEESYKGDNAGKIAVLGDGLKFERMTVSAVDAQLIDQLKWSVEDVARAFRYPLFKLQAGAPILAGSAEELNLQYYSDTLQPLIEAMEDVMNAGLDLPSTLHVELDIEGLGRMNTEARFRTAGESLKIASPNEARARLNLPPVYGGDSVYVQVQNYSLSDLVRLRQMEFARMENPQPAAQPEPPPTPTEDQTRAFIDRLKKGLGVE
jgi:HK97 family phage portal protein